MTHLPQCDKGHEVQGIHSPGPDTLWLTSRRDFEHGYKIGYVMGARDIDNRVEHAKRHSREALKKSDDTWLAISVGVACLFFGAGWLVKLMGWA